MGAWRASTLAACAALVAGCTGQPTVLQYVPPSAACCSGPAQFTFRPLPLGQEAEFSLSAADPTYDFSGRRAHFVALRIPDGFSASAIQVKSYLSTAYLPNASAVLPDFVYLDRELRTIGRASSGDFQNAGGFWRSAVSGRARVPAAARYIVVIAGDGSGGLPALYSENRTPYRVRPAALGEFSLRLFGEAVHK